MLSLYQTLAKYNKRFVDACQFDRDWSLYYDHAVIPLSLASGELPSLLAHLSESRLFYFQNRKRTLEFLAWGCCENYSYDNQDALEKLIQLAQKTGKPWPFILLGGQAFSPETLKTREWQAFSSCQFFIPNYLLVRSGPNLQFFIFNKNKSALPFPRLNGHSTHPVLSKMKTEPGKKSYQQSFNRVIEEMKKGELNKIILAKRQCREYDQGPDLKTLIKKTEHHPQTNNFTVFYQVDEQNQMLCLSPERLYFYDADKKRLKTEAIAGTESAKNPQENHKLEREHQFVVDYLRKRYLELGIKLKSDGLEFLQMRHLRHWRTGFASNTRLTASQHLAILRSIHPSSALCGEPQELAREIIQKEEGFERGWYTGLLGYLGQQSEMVVNIRLAQRHKNRVYTYAGGGLILGSELESEWRELEQKMLFLTELLALQSP